MMDVNMSKRYDLLIFGGLGHVGLPLGIMLADAGANVALYDIDHAQAAVVASGVMPFVEYDAEPILRRVIGRNLHIVHHVAAAAESKSVIVTIGTPVDEYLNPKLLPIFKAAD